MPCNGLSTPPKCSHTYVAGWSQPTSVWDIENSNKSPSLEESQQQLENARKVNIISLLLGVVKGDLMINREFFCVNRRLPNPEALRAHSLTLSYPNLSIT